MDEIRLKIDELSKVLYELENDDEAIKGLRAAKQMLNNRLDEIEVDAYDMLKQLPESRAKIDASQNIFGLLAALLGIQLMFSRLNTLEVKLVD